MSLQHTPAELPAQSSHGLAALLRQLREELERRPALAASASAGALRSACDELLAQIHTDGGVTAQVLRTLRAERGPGASMKAVAAALRMTDRTLRRRLADEGTSFSALSHQVRCGVAAEYLRASAASVEQIADLVGYSDPSNFRRAFVRWTTLSPAQFRRQRRGTAAAAPAG